MQSTIRPRILAQARSRDEERPIAINIELDRNAATPIADGENMISRQLRRALDRVGVSVV